MKKNYLPIVFTMLIVSILLAGCGGGGGGGGGNGGNGGSTGLNPIRAEVAPSGSPNTPIDPFNIQAGESVVFQVVGYTSTGQRQILTSTNWTSSDNGNVSGILQSDGTLNATNPSGALNFTASGIANGTTYTTQYHVKPVQALVTALVRDSNGLPSDRVAVALYNSAGTEVSRAVSQFDGTVRISTPTTADTFSLVATTLPKSRYFKSYVYDGARYSVLIASCKTELPALTNGTTTPLGTITIDAAKTGGLPNPPPPPPDGCPTS